MDRVIEQLPRFLSPLNLLFLAEAMGMTLALTFFGCGLGFLPIWFSNEARVEEIIAVLK